MGGGSCLWHYILWVLVEKVDSPSNVYVCKLIATSILICIAFAPCTSLPFSNVRNSRIIVIGGQH